MSESITLTISTPDFSKISLPPWAWTLLGFYVLIAVITFGYYFRASRRSRGRLGTLIRVLLFPTFWPFYWLAVIGPVDTICTFSSAVGRIRMEILFVYYSLALIFVPAFQLYINWDHCTTFGSCSGTVVKAFLVGLVWPILGVAYLLGF
jgi:hypothetical protein